MRLCFNPRPAGRPGDAQGGSVHQISPARFNPRPAGRPGDASRWGYDAHPMACFNPRPAGRPGDAHFNGPYPLPIPVSIRARPGGRAMQISPARIRERVEFQSAPGREAGRCLDVTACDARQLSFNPRPAGRPGDAVLLAVVALLLLKVSIRARPGGRAMPIRFIEHDARPLVSIRARPGGRAMPRRWEDFMPGASVSIRARPGGRAMLHSRNLLFRLRNGVSLREPAGTSNTRNRFQVAIHYQIVKEQGVTPRAKPPRFCRRLGFALHINKGPSKSMERKVPNCLTRTSTGSVMR